MKNLISEIDRVFEEFIQIITSLSNEQLHTSPFESSWTAGQLSQHVIKYSSGLAEILNGPVKETNRKFDDKVKMIKSDFLNFNIKMKSPKFLVPENMKYDKETILNQLEKNKKEIISVAPNLDLTQTCLAFEIPVYGKLTRFEMLYFILFHTQRHVHQLKNIHDVLALKII